jgi:hypothetical protein
MKKILSFSFVFGFALLGTAHAQLTGYGIKVARTYPNYDWRTQYPTQISPPLTNLPGYNLAVYAEWYDLDYLSIMTQLEYSQRGNQSSDPWDPSSYPPMHNRVSYLSLPIFAKVTPINTLVRPYLLIGPRIDYLVGKEIEDIGLGVVYNHLKTWVLGYSIGVGLESHNLFGVNISLEARYNRDITNSAHGGGIEVFNKAFDLWLGVGI